MNGCLSKSKLWKKMKNVDEERRQQEYRENNNLKAPDYSKMQPKMPDYSSSFKMPDVKMPSF